MTATKDEKARAELRKLRSKHRPVSEPKTYIAALEEAYVERLRINYSLIEAAAQQRRDYRPREAELELSLNGNGNGHHADDDSIEEHVGRVPALA